MRGLIGPGSVRGFGGAAAVALGMITAGGVAAAPAPAPAPDFTLVNQDGRPISLHQFRGRLVILTFLYTHCPDICPLTTAKLVQVQRELKKRGWFGPKVVFLSLTFDPQRDTPAVLKAYAAKFQVDHAGWHFLSGDPAAVRKVIDPQGRILGHYNPDFDPRDALRDIAHLLGS